MNELSRSREPMNQLLLQWLKARRKDFEAMGISLEIIDHTKEIKEKNLQNPAQVAFLVRSTRIGEIRVWMSGIAEMQILNYEGEDIYAKHYDDINGKDFEDVFRDFFFNLCR